MKAIIFAGGIGTRLWPLSRQNTPKQFENIIGHKSTLQLALDRLAGVSQPHEIFISTGQKYINIVKKQAPMIPSQNFIVEPEMRDVAPAIGLAMIHLQHKGLGNQPVAILWSDHLLTQVDNFKAVLIYADKFIRQHQDKFLFIGQVPRFPSENLGWIEFGALIEQTNNFSVHHFKSWHYRPPKHLAQQYFTDQKHVWNVGYFVVTPNLVLSYYQKLAPSFYQHLNIIKQSINTEKYPTILKKHYSQLDKISFDNLILEKVEPNRAVVVKVELGWADIGTWESLWEILEKDRDNNLKRGEIITTNTRNSLIYNYDPKKVIVGIDLNNLVIVNTKDIILICPKDASAQIKEVVKKLQKDKKYAKHT